MCLNAPLGKQGPHSPRVKGSDIVIGWAGSPEVVPDEGTAGTQDAGNLGRDGGLRLRWNRAEHRHRENAVERFVVVGQTCGVGDTKCDLWPGQARAIDSFGQQVDALTRSHKPPVNQVRQRTPVAASDVEEPPLLETRSREEARDRLVTLMNDRLLAGIGPQARLYRAAPSDGRSKSLRFGGRVGRLRGVLPHRVQSHGQIVLGVKHDPPAGADSDNRGR